MINPYGLHQLILEAVLDHGRVTLEDLPGIESEQVVSLTHELLDTNLLVVKAGELRLTGLGLDMLERLA